MTEKMYASSQKQYRFRPANNRGSVLVVTLLTLAILSIFSVSLSQHVRQKISFSERIDRRELLYGVAQKGIQLAVEEIQRDDKSEGYDIGSEPWGINKKLFKNILAEENAFYSVSYEFYDADEGAVKIVYGAQDEEGKLNINTAKPEAMSALFQMIADLDEDEANDIAYGIVDWRDSDNFAAHPNYGAEDDFYEDKKEPYGAKDHAFQVLNELLLVHGVTYEIYEKIKDKLTVYGSGAVNFNTASKEVLMALGLDEDLVVKILTFRRGEDKLEFTRDDRICRQPSTITSDLTVVLGLSGGEVAPISNLVAQGLFATLSEHFMVRSKGILKNGALLVEIITVVDRSGKTKFWFSSTPKRPDQAVADETQIAKIEVGENEEERDS